MKATSFALLLAVGIFSTSILNAQQKYEGIMVTKLGGQQTGILTVNLNGPNGELIEIGSSTKNKTKSSGKIVKQTVSTGLKLNVALISYIIINDTTYYFRDIKYDYNEKYYRNMCVRLMEGTLNCGMFQTGTSQGLNNISIKLPKSEFSNLVSADFDYYKLTDGWHMMNFWNCKVLREKMEKKEAGYKWDEKNSPEQRIAMWKNWIREFNECKKNE